MPILLPVKLKQLDKEEFKALDYKVMGHAYQCQTDLGRLLNLTELRAIQWVNFNRHEIDLVTIGK